MPDGKYLWTAKVGEKGQIVIPKEAREIFNIHPKDTLIILGDINRGLALVHYDNYAEFATAILNSIADKEDNQL